MPANVVSLAQSKIGGPSPSSKKAISRALRKEGNAEYKARTAARKEQERTQKRARAAARAEANKTLSWLRKRGLNATERTFLVGNG